MQQRTQRTPREPEQRLELVMAAAPKSGGTYDTLIKLLLIGDSGACRRSAEVHDAPSVPLER